MFPPLCLLVFRLPTHPTHVSRITCDSGEYKMYELLSFSVCLSLISLCCQALCACFFGQKRGVAEDIFHHVSLC